MEEIEVAYMPAKPKTLPKELVILGHKRSVFVQDDKPVKCKCGGFVVGVFDWEEVMPGHSVAARRGRTIGGCSNAITSFEG